MHHFSEVVSCATKTYIRSYKIMPRQTGVESPLPKSPLIKPKFSPSKPLVAILLAWVRCSVSWLVVCYASVRRRYQREIERAREREIDR